MGSSFKTTAATPEAAFALGETIGRELRAGDLVLLTGGLGAGKTLLIKGIVSALGYDVDEVTSPSFTLVNHYRTDGADIFHIDLWRLDDHVDAGLAVGLDEILDNPGAIVLVEWAEKLRGRGHAGRTISISIKGDGDDPRQIDIAGLPLGKQ